MEQYYRDYKLLHILQALTYLTMLLCDTLAFKTISIFGHMMAATGIIFVFSFLWLNVIATVYGGVQANRTMVTTLFLQITFVIIVSIFCRLYPLSGGVNSFYYKVYSHLWVFLFSSTIGVFFSFYLNNVLISKIKIWLSGTYTIVRTIICNALSKAVLVTVSYPINFMFIYPPEKIVSLAFNTWIFKVFVGSFVVILLFSPICYLIRRLEKLDVYDVGVSHSLTKLYSEDNNGINKYKNYL